MESDVVVLEGETAAGRLAGAADAVSAGRGDTGRRYGRISMWLAASDALCISTALVVSYTLRFGLRPMPLRYALVTITAPVIWMGVFYAFGLYAPEHLSAPEIFRRTVGATSVGAVLLAMGSFWARLPLSRAWIGATWLLALLFELAVRRAWAWRIGRLRRDGGLSFRTLIVGDNEEAGRLAHAIAAPGSGYTALGFVRLSPSTESPDFLPVLGEIDRLDDVVKRASVDCLFVASTAIDSQSMLRVTQAARHAGLEIRVSANLPQILTSRLTVQQVGRTMALSLKPVRLSGTQALMKRAFDLVVASVALVVTLPLFVLVAAIIPLTSPGPILFRQRRVTRGGRAFTVYKFRTMSLDGDRILAERMIDPTAPFFKMQDDPRLTRFGRVVRRLSLDELPQLLNVLKGDMSLVGPRPLPVDQVEANPELLGPRHEVLAGVSGWWQINGRSSVTPEEAVNYDIFYIENWSLALDLYILFKSVGAVLSQRGAY